MAKHFNSLSTVGRLFYVWFITLCITVVSLVLILEGEVNHIWYLHVIAGVTISPLAGVLTLIFKTKRDVKRHEIRLEKKKAVLDYKLEKLRIKKDKG